MFGMIRPSPRTTVIDVIGGLSEVEECLAVKSTTASGIGSDHDRSPVQLEVKRTVGLGLAPDHSDTSHSNLRCIHGGLNEEQPCITDPYSSVTDKFMEGVNRRNNIRYSPPTFTHLVPAVMEHTDPFFVEVDAFDKMVTYELLLHLEEEVVGCHSPLVLPPCSHGPPWVKSP